MAINITISSDEVIEDVNNPLSVENKKTPPQEAEKVSGKLSKGATALIKFGIDQAKTMAMEGIKTYTSFTGNSMLQQKIDNTLSLVNMGSTVGIAFATNWALGLVSIGAYGVQAGLSVYRANVEAKVAERTQSFILQGMGKRNISGGQYGA